MLGLLSPVPGSNALREAMSKAYASFSSSMYLVLVPCRASDTYYKGRCATSLSWTRTTLTAAASATW